MIETAYSAFRKYICEFVSAESGRLEWREKSLVENYSTKQFANT